jgi:hypothetical protein
MEYIYFNSTEQDIGNVTCPHSSFKEEEEEKMQPRHKEGGGGGLRAEDKYIPRRRYVSLALVSDYARLALFGFDRAKLHSSNVAIATQMQFIYSLFPTREIDPAEKNQLDSGGIKLDIVSIIEMTTKAPWTGLTNYETILNLFNEWVQDTPGISHQLLSGEDFDGGVVGLAHLSTICNRYLKYGLGIVQATSSLDAISAKIAAHELGHNLGFYHITQYASRGTLSNPSSIEHCKLQYQSVMYPIILGAGVIWDKCTTTWWQDRIQGYPRNCASSGGCNIDPYPASCMLPKTVSCGNGLLEEGEECDCGEPCNDPCCNANTCKLIGQCSPLIHECCTPSCAVRRGGGTCRGTFHPFCDRQETCDGINRDCPVDTFMNQREGCVLGDDLGVCYNGRCVSRSIQCNSIPEKYAYFKDGECARSTEGDVACGVLYCKSSSFGHCTQVFAPGLLRVQDGSACGEGMY